MSQTHTVRVKWEIDVEVPLGTTDWEIAMQTAEKYFQPRIPAGEPDTACVFEVGGQQIDLSAKISPELELAHAAEKVLEEFRAIEDSGDKGTFGMDENPSIITLRKLISEARGF